MEDDFKLHPHTEIPDRKNPDNVEGEAEYSLDVFIIDCDDCRGVAFYDFMLNEWAFHTEHITNDIDSPDDPFSFVWFYGPGRESI